MKTIKIITLFITVFFVGFSYGQQKLIGKVMTNKKANIVNAKVYLDTVDSGTRSNNRGYFEVIIPDYVKEIHIYSEKYGLLSSSYAKETKMNFIFLDPEYMAEEEKDKVNIGYGQEEKEDLAYRVQNLDIDKDKQAYAYDNIYDLIRGRLAGVFVTDDNRIIIRGPISFAGSSSPLFVVDGNIVYSIDHIFPRDVKDISVLKGAAASIYGSRGAGGVIQITTKNN